MKFAWIGHAPQIGMTENALIFEACPFFFLIDNG
jgi:hypothetical protein